MQQHIVRHTVPYVDSRRLSKFVEDGRTVHRHGRQFNRKLFWVGGRGFVRFAGAGPAVQLRGFLPPCLPQPTFG